MAAPDELFLLELNNIFIETKKTMAKNGFLDPYINITTEPITAAISASLFFESKYAFNCQSTDKSSTFDNSHRIRTPFRSGTMTYHVDNSSI